MYTSPSHQATHDYLVFSSKSHNQVTSKKAGPTGSYARLDAVPEQSSGNTQGLARGMRSILSPNKIKMGVGSQEGSWARVDTLGFEAQPHLHYVTLG